MTVMDSVALRARIRQLRVQKHLTQQDVADKIGISLRAYSYMASGRRKLPYSRIVQIAEALEVTVEDLFAGSGGSTGEAERLRRMLAESEARVRMLEEKLEDRESLIAAQRSDLASKDKIIRMQEKQLGESD